MGYTDEGQAFIESLKKTRPEVAITVSRQIDPYFTWDGDGPDPAEEGYEPYDVTVTAITIKNGVLYTGTSVLGGSYFQSNEPSGEIHGYLHQMVEEALKELDKAALAASVAE